MRLDGNKETVISNLDEKKLNLSSKKALADSKKRFKKARENQKKKDQQREDDLFNKEADRKITKSEIAKNIIGDRAKKGKGKDYIKQVKVRNGIKLDLIANANTQVLKRILSERGISTTDNTDKLIFDEMRVMAESMNPNSGDFSNFIINEADNFAKGLVESYVEDSIEDYNDYLAEMGTLFKDLVLVEAEEGIEIVNNKISEVIKAERKLAEEINGNSNLEEHAVVRRKQRLLKNPTLFQTLYRHSADLQLEEGVKEINLEDAFNTTLIAYSILEMANTFKITRFTKDDVLSKIRKMESRLYKKDQLREGTSV